MKTPRFIAKRIASAGGYFWLPCTLCGQRYGGQEWKKVNGHEFSIPEPSFKRGQFPTSSQGICPDCTAVGAGCRAWRAVGIKIHRNCPALVDQAHELRRRDER